MKKYKINALFCVCLTLFQMGGCMDSDDERNHRPGTGNKLNIQFTLPQGTLKTRAVPAEQGENTVNDLTLLFFAPSSNGTGTYIGYYRVPDEDLVDEGELSSTNTFNLEVKFNSGSGMSVTNAYNILAFANMKENYLDNLDQEFDSYIDMISSMNEQDVKNYTVMTVEGVGTDQNDNMKAMPQNNIPMSAAFSKAEKEENVVCDLTRAVSRFDVVNSVSSHVLVSASIWNAYPQGTVWDTRSLDYSYDHLKRYYGVKDIDSQEIKGGLYAFENVSTNPDIKDETTTCIILGFKPDIPNGEVTYYRVNISPQVTGQYLLRNNVYQITVSGISGPGDNTEEDAYTSGKMLLDISINSWDRDEDGLIIRDGDNLLAIPSKRVVFGPKGDSRQYYVYTMGTGKLEMEVINLPEGIEAWLGGNGNDLFITAQPYTLSERKGAIELRFAGMKGVMEIIQTGNMNKFLTLEHVYVADYPAGLDKQNMISLNPIRINSSGPWTAEIHNGNFSFDPSTMSTTLAGVNGESISNIFNWSINTEEKARTSFVLVSLDEDPDHYRNVVVLKQVGNGKFTLNPDNETVRFDSDGNLIVSTNNSNRFSLTTESSLSWTIELLGDHPDAFEYEFESGNVSDNNTCTGDGVFTVSTKGENYSGEKTALLKITHNGLNTKVITLNQTSHTLTLTPNSITDVPAIGGISKSVTVTSSLMNGTWSAEIVASNFTNLLGDGPKLVNENGDQVDQLNSQAIGKTFRVYMPGIDQHLSDAQQPIVEVEVTIDGKPLVSTLHVTQEMVKYVNIHAQSINNILGNWAAAKSGEYYKVFGQWADEMTNGSNFGPGISTSNGVYTKSTINISKQSYLNILAIDGVNPRIINMNNVSVKGNIDYTVFKNDPNTVMIIYTWDAYKAPFTYLTLGDLYNPVKPAAQFDKLTPRKIYQGNEDVKNTKLWKYIFDGPFGTVDIDNVTIYPQHYPLFMNCLDKWPDTMIPLMMAPTASGNPNTALLLMGIDPTNRIIWIGHKDLFGNDGIAHETLPNWNNEDNLKFLRNVIAWMVNVNNYGDAFNNQFKETGTWGKQ